MGRKRSLFQLFESWTSFGPLFNHPTHSLYVRILVREDSTEHMECQQIMTESAKLTRFSNAQNSAGEIMPRERILAGIATRHDESEVLV